MCRTSDSLVVAFGRTGKRKREWRQNEEEKRGQAGMKLRRQGWEWKRRWREEEKAETVKTRKEKAE
ncbi:hypothetical protein BDW75DRAFT_198553 [Aspergillus navahoensis]